MRRYNPRFIKGRHSYLIEEIARLFGINKKTCLRWLQEGLEPIEPNTKPLLIWGNDLRFFLVQKQKKQKVPLKKNEFYCFKCKQAVKAQANTEKIIPTGKKIGREAKAQLCRVGDCSLCGAQLTRFL